MDLRDYDRVPPVAAAMTPFPHYVLAETPVDEIEALMDQHAIRHVPVQQGREVVGMVSRRDLQRLVNPSLPAVDRRRIRARDIMVRDPFVVDFATPLDEVLQEMAERRIGSTVVVHNGRLAGIFSVTDACRVLAQVLEARFRPGPDEAA